MATNTTRSFRSYAAVWVCLAVLAACSWSTTMIPEEGPPMLTWTLGPGDRIDVKIFVGRTPELTGSTFVRPDGNITLPLLGDVQVEGLSLQESATLISKRAEDLYKRPSVTVSAVELKSHRYFLMGEIGSAGAKPFIRPTTLLVALADAGGFKAESAFVSDVRIIRGVLQDPAVIRVNVNQILNGEITDIPLRDGDIVYVPAHPITQWNRVMGQLLQPFSTGASTATYAKTLSQ